ncbi:MAG: hypothetical protein JST91_30880 [Actinobacteria bacterium]|nr:hypothetical protein [Actinomycetota bacterium]
MSTDPDQLRAQVAALLDDLPDIEEMAGDPAQVVDIDVDAVAVRLEEAHDLLVGALEAVEKGPNPGTVR